MGFSIRRARDSGTSSQLMPAGSVTPFAGATAPSGWLMCGGQAISRAQFSELFAIIGTTYGSGDGSTTFNIPDLRGRVIAGEDDMGGTAANRLTSAGSGINGLLLGAVGGTQTMTIGSANLPIHTHAINHDHGSFNATSGGQSATHNHGPGNETHFVTVSTQTVGGIAGSGVYQAPYNKAATTGNASGDHTHTTTIDVPNFTGSSGDGGFANSATNNTQPTIILNYIIKV